MCRTLTVSIAAGIPRDVANPSDGGLWNHPRAPFGFPKRRAYQLLLQNVARGLAGDTGSPRSHRLIEPFAVPPFRVIPGQVKRQLGCAARGFAKTVCTHEQALTVLGAGFMKGGLLGIWAIVRKLVLGRTLRLHRLKPSYGGLDLLRRQAVNVEVQTHCQPHQRRAMRAAPVLCAPRSCADAAPGEARRSVRRPGPT